MTRLPAGTIEPVTLDNLSAVARASVERIRARRGDAAADSFGRAVARGWLKVEEEANGEAYWSTTPEGLRVVAEAKRLREAGSITPRTRGRAGLLARLWRWFARPARTNGGGVY